MRTTSFTTSSSLTFLDRPERAKDIVRFEFRFYQLTLIVLDLVLAYLAFRASYLIRFEAGIPLFQDSIIPREPYYVDLMLISIPIWVAIFALMGLYNLQNLLGGTREYSLLFQATTMGMFVIISAGFLFPEELIIARGWVILAWLMAFLFTAIGRFLYRRVIYGMRYGGHFQNPAVIIGANQEGQMLAEQFHHWRTSGIRIVGFLDDQQDPCAKVKILGKLDELDRIIAQFGITDIILSSSALSQAEILALFRKYGTAKNINLRMSSGLYEVITTGMQVKEDGLVSLLTINKVRMTGVEQVGKLLMDYIVASIAVVLLLPVFIVVGVLVKLDSPGPIFHRRRVMGVNGRQFDAFKFRTMHINSDEILKAHPELLEEYEKNFKIKNDPRITRIGHFLRKTSIDELPQLVNVLRNEMSLVGPRMICPEELSKYNQWDINLLTVKPGITGLWQVRGRSDVSYEERVRMDMHYIRNWTIWLDLQLLFQTVPAVLSHKGAY